MKTKLTNSLNKTKEIVEILLLIVSLIWNIPTFIVWFIVYPKKIINFIKLQKNIKYEKN